MLSIHVGLQEKPADHRGDVALAADEILIEAEDYEEGMAAARRRVPEGWRMIYTRVERPTDPAPR